MSILSLFWFTEKFRCKDPVLHKNVEIVNKARYKLFLDSRTFGPMKRKGFYDGDEIEYRCKSGQVAFISLTFRSIQ